MVVTTHIMQRSTTAETDLIDLTDEVSRLIHEAGLREGTVILFCPGSTGALTTIEYEPGVVEDLRKAIERMAPQDIPYAHDRRWGDGNGHSHVRAALVGPSLAIPVSKGRALLGTWQQIILCDFDVRSRERQIVVQILGEGVE